MKISQKLLIIQKQLGTTQTKLAERFSVSFATFNSWINNRSEPHAKSGQLIEDLFLELTGQSIVSDLVLNDAKKNLKQKSLKHKKIISEILNNPDIRDRFILKLTYHSNKIEGSTLTEPDTAAILFNNVALPNKSLTEHLEAKNHQTALNYLFDYLNNNGQLNEALVLKLHSILMNGVRSDAGLYRNHQVRIMGVNLPTANYLRVPDLIPEIIKKAAKNNSDVISAAADMHSHFEQVHPFSDGNGRVGRLFINAMFLKSNLAPAIIRQEQKQLYYTYLYKAQTSNDQSQLEYFFCESLINGFKILEREDIN